MDDFLLRTLIEKNHFKVATEVNAKARGRSLCGNSQHMFEDTYTVTGIFESRNTGKVVMSLMSARDGATVKVQSDALTMIDGMTPLRFAENYMIAPDGTDIKVVGKRRGRRPKNWNPELDG